VFSSLLARAVPAIAAAATAIVPGVHHPAGYTYDGYCAAVPAYTGTGPAGYEIPPWGFHTGLPISGNSGNYARAWGDINLNTNWINGKVCQVQKSASGPFKMIVMAPESHIIYHTHVAQMWGYPGNLIKVHVKVKSSTDAACKVGTVGQMNMFGSYNGVRSDSIQFVFPKACKNHNHTYHGSQVNAQVPPL
jgi:hypothetical protein